MKAYHYVNNYGELHRLTPQRYAKYLRDVADGGDVTDAPRLITHQHPNANGTESREGNEMQTTRFKVQNMDGSARRAIHGSVNEIVERLEYLCAVEGWDEVVVDGNTYSILGSNLVSVASRIQRQVRR